MNDESDDDETTTPRRYFSLCGSIETPPVSATVRRQAGFLIRALQDRKPVLAPHYKAIPEIGPGCGELRFSDGTNRKEWRLFVFCDATHVLLLAIHEKRTQKTPKPVIDLCRRRLANWRAGR